MTAAKKPVEGVVVASATKSVLSAADALGAFNNVVDGTRDFLRLREEQLTKRANLEAYATVEVERIQQASSALKDYFVHVFAERAKTIDGLFQRLDDAVASGDTAMSTAAVQGIVDLAKSSPLAAISDLSQVRRALDDPDHIWEF